MTGVRYVPCAVLAVVVLFAVYAEARNDCPPENPFCPIWVPCNFTQVQGPYCQDCTTIVICTPIGGLVLPCTFPGSGYCTLGQCSSQPSEECASQTSSTPGTTQEQTTPLAR